MVAPTNGNSPSRPNPRTHDPLVGAVTLLGFFGGICVCLLVEIILAAIFGEFTIKVR